MEVGDSDQVALRRWLADLKKFEPGVWALTAHDVRARVEDLTEEDGLSVQQVERLIRAAIGRLRIILAVEDPDRMNVPVVLERMVRNGARLKVAYQEFNAQTSEFVGGTVEEAREAYHAPTTAKLLNAIFGSTPEESEQLREEADT